MNKYACLLFLFCFGCSKKPQQTALKVSVIDSATISISNVDNNLLANLQQDSLGNAQWQSLLPVCRMPADTDMRDLVKPLPGKYAVKNSTVVFAADTPFKKGQQYFARFYHFQDDSNIWAVIKGKWKQHTPQYRECTFVR